MYQVLDGHKRI